MSFTPLVITFTIVFQSLHALLQTAAILMTSATATATAVTSLLHVLTSSVLAVTSYCRRRLSGVETNEKDREFGKLLIYRRCYGPDYNPPNPPHFNRVDHNASGPKIEYISVLFSNSSL